LRTVANGCERLRSRTQRRANTPSTPRPPEWNGNPCYAFGKKVKKSSLSLSLSPSPSQEISSQAHLYKIIYSSIIIYNHNHLYDVLKTHYLSINLGLLVVPMFTQQASAVWLAARKIRFGLWQSLQHEDCMPWRKNGLVTRMIWAPMTWETSIECDDARFLIWKIHENPSYT